MNALDDFFVTVGASGECVCFSCDGSNQCECYGTSECDTCNSPDPD